MKISNKFVSALNPSKLFILLPPYLIFLFLPFSSFFFCLCSLLALLRLYFVLTFFSFRLLSPFCFHRSHVSSLPSSFFFLHYPLSSSIDLLLPYSGPFFFEVGLFLFPLLVYFTCSSSIFLTFLFFHLATAVFLFLLPHFLFPSCVYFFLNYVRLLF